MIFLRESSIVFRRQIRMNLRNPAWVLIGLMQPVLYLVLFGPLLKPLAAQFGYSNAYTFFVPGLLVQLGIFGAFFAGFSLIGDDSIGRLVVEGIGASPAILLKNHGVFTIGPSAKSAVKAAVMTEDVAATVFMALQLGTPDEISPDAVASLHDRYTNVYGQ